MAVSKGHRLMLVREDKGIPDNDAGIDERIRVECIGSTSVVCVEQKIALGLIQQFVLSKEKQTLCSVAYL